VHLRIGEAELHASIRGSSFHKNDDYREPNRFRNVGDMANIVRSEAMKLSIKALVLGVAVAATAGALATTPASAQPYSHRGYGYGHYGQHGYYGRNAPGNYFYYHRGRLSGGRNSAAESAGGW
jgi:hypothetical protein